MLVYFSGVSHNQKEKEYLNLLVERIEHNSFEVFWPERDKVEEKKKIDKIKDDFKKELLIKKNIISKAEIFVFFYGGHELGKEEILELGIVYGFAEIQKPKKLIVAIDISSKEFFWEKKVDDKIKAVVDCIAKSEYALIDCLKSFMVTVQKLK